MVYAIAPRNAGTSAFLQQLVARHILQKVTALPLPLNLQQCGFESKLLLQKKNALQTRLNTEKVLYLLKKKQNSKNKNIKRSSAVSVI